MNYTDLADTLAMDICYDCPAFNESRHTRGVLRRDEQGEPVLHWRERRMASTGVYNFLKLAAKAYQPLGLPFWKRIWLANVTAYNLAETHLHRQLPRRYADKDRAHVRWLLRNPVLRSKNEEARRAWRWAQQS